MTLRKIIKIESKKVFKKPTNLCKINGDIVWYMFTDMTTQSTGLIPRKQLEKDYEEMVGFSSDNKQLYMERLK